jgi:CysZ protein
MIDYRNEFKNYSAKESRAIINDHKGLAIGVGTMFNLILLVPVLGALVAPVIAVVAGGLAINKADI